MSAIAWDHEEKVLYYGRFRTPIADVSGDVKVADAEQGFYVDRRCILPSGF